MMLSVATVQKHSVSVQCGYLLQGARHRARSRRSRQALCLLSTSNDGLTVSWERHGFRMLATILRDCGTHRPRSAISADVSDTVSRSARHVCSVAAGGALNHNNHQPTGPSVTGQ